MQVVVVQGLLDVSLPKCKLVHEKTLKGGLKRLKSGRFDAVLLDLGLPDSKGVDAVPAVCKGSPGTPVVVLTAQGTEELGAICIQAGAQDFLEKQHLNPVRLAKALDFATLRQSGSVDLNLDSMLTWFRSLAQLGAGHLDKKFGTQYERLFCEPNFLLSPGHDELIEEMGQAEVPPGAVFSLHAEVLQRICEEADPGDRARYLRTSSYVAMATVGGLANYYLEEKIISAWGQSDGPKTKKKKKPKKRALLRGLRPK